MGNEDSNEGVRDRNGPYKIPLAVMKKGDGDCVDFLVRCLDKNYNKRWSAKQLLKHPFLCRDEEQEGVMATDVKRANDTNIDDLEFMTEALISYYLHFNKSRRASKRMSFNDLVTMEISPKSAMVNRFEEKTPIDDKWTDQERIQNIAKYCGYSVDAVQDFIFEYVNDVK